MSDRIILGRIEREHNGAKYFVPDPGEGDPIKDTVILVNGSLNGTTAPVGTHGRVQYRNGGYYGLYFFVPDPTS